MKMQVQYCESFRTFLQYDDYTIDTKNFPELENLDYEYVTQWINENTDSLSVKDEDGNLEIVPFDENLPVLADTLTEGGVNREKTIDNDSWFEYMGDDYDSDEESDGEEPDDEDEE
jgi:hypothetical protein